MTVSHAYTYVLLRALDSKRRIITRMIPEISQGMETVLFHDNELCLWYPKTENKFLFGF